MALYRKLLVLACAFMIQIGSASATLLSVDLSSTGDGLVTYDDASGLEWLDVSQTDGMSYSAALSAFSSGGWGYASEGQFESLIDSHFTEYSQNSVYGFMGVTDPSTSYTQAVEFANLFGVTWTGASVDFFSYGFYVDNNGVYKLGGVSLGSYGANIHRDYYYDYASIKNTGHSQVGVYLVRNAVDSDGDGLADHSDPCPFDVNNSCSMNPPTAGVPEPSSIALLALGLIGFGTVFRKKAHKK